MGCCQSDVAPPPKGVTNQASKPIPRPRPQRQTEAPQAPPPPPPPTQPQPPSERRVPPEEEKKPSKTLPGPTNPKPTKQPASPNAKGAGKTPARTPLPGRTSPAPTVRASATPQRVNVERNTNVSSTGGASSSSSSHQQLETLERTSHERRRASATGGTDDKTATDKTDAVKGPAKAPANGIPPPTLSPMEGKLDLPDAVTPDTQKIASRGVPNGSGRQVNPILTGLHSQKEEGRQRLNFDGSLSATEGGEMLKHSQRANPMMAKKIMEFSNCMRRTEDSDNMCEQEMSSGLPNEQRHTHYSPNRGQSEDVEESDDCPRLRHLPSMLRREDSFLQDDIYGENINYRSSLAAHTGHEGRLFCSLRTSGLIPPPALRGEDDPPDAPRLSSSAPHYSARAQMLFGIALSGGDLMGASIPASRLRVALSQPSSPTSSPPRAPGKHNPRVQKGEQRKDENKLLRQSGWPQAEGPALVDFLLASTRHFAGGVESLSNDGDPLISQEAVQHFAKCKDLFEQIDAGKTGEFTAWELATALRDQFSVQTELSIPPYLATPLFRQIVPGKPYATLVAWYSYFHDKTLKFASQPVASFRDVLRRLLDPPYSFSDGDCDLNERVDAKAIIAKFKSDRYLQLELGWPDPEASLSALGSSPRREDMEKLLKLRWAWTRADAAHDGFIGACELGDALEEADVAACLGRCVGDVKTIWKELDTSGTGVTMWYDFFKFFSEHRVQRYQELTQVVPKRRANAELQQNFNLDLLKSNARINVDYDDLNSTQQLNKKRRHALAIPAIAAALSILPCSEPRPDPSPPTPDEAPQADMAQSLAAFEALEAMVQQETPRRRVSLKATPEVITTTESREIEPLQKVPQPTPKNERQPPSPAKGNQRENLREVPVNSRESLHKRDSKRSVRREVPASRPSRPRGNSGGASKRPPSAPVSQPSSPRHAASPPNQANPPAAHADPNAAVYSYYDNNSPPTRRDADDLPRPSTSYTIQQQYAEAPTPKFPELMHPGDRYNKMKKLGEGNFGIVFLVERKSDGLLLVTKEPKRPSGSMTAQKRAADARRMRKVQKEAAHLMRLRHPNILRFIEAYWENGALVIVTEYCDGGDLAAWLTRYRSTASISVKWNIFEQIAAALLYMHERGVMHRDLKPANILLTSRSMVKLADFGLARALRPEEEVAHTICGTELYMAPEVHNRTPYGRSADVFALGCILYQMVKGRKPFVNLMELLECKPPQDAPKYAAKLIRDMLQADHNLRPTMTAVLRRCPEYRPRRKQATLFLLWWKRRQQQQQGWLNSALAIRVLSFHMIISY